MLFPPSLSLSSRQMFNRKPHLEWEEEGRREKNRNSSRSRAAKTYCSRWHIYCSGCCCRRSRSTRRKRELVEAKSILIACCSEIRHSGSGTPTTINWLTDCTTDREKEIRQTATTRPSSCIIMSTVLRYLFCKTHFQPKFLFQSASA